MSGVQFVETASVAEAKALGAGVNDILTIVTGDLRAVVPTVPTGPGGVEGISGQNSTVGYLAVIDKGENFTPAQNQYGGKWFRIAMNEIGRLLGLNEALDLNAILGSGANGGLGIEPTNPLTVEPVFPGNDDIVHLRRLFRRDSNDIDMYRFEMRQTGTVTIETLAKRLESSSQLNTVLTLYKETATATGLVREVIARNDDYYGTDSFLKLQLEGDANNPVVYYVGVSSVGNETYDPRVPDSGSQGTTDGAYELRMDFLPDPTAAIVDADSTPQPDGTLRPATPIDGNGDGKPGGIFDFSFQVGDTIFVDKSASGATPNGSINNPYTEIDQALTEAKARRDGTSPNAVAGDNVPVIVRIVGNSGLDGQLATLGDNQAYQIGVNDSNFPLEDGKTLNVPKDVTVVIDGGAVLKLQDVNLDVGTSSQGIDRSGGALQILGTTFNDVVFTSWHDDTIGRDTDGVHPGPSGGDWGGIVYRADSDYDFEYTSSQTQTNFFDAQPRNGNFGAPRTFTFTGFPVDANEATFTFTAVANLAAANEFIRVNISGLPGDYDLFVTDGANSDTFGVGDVPVPVQATIKLSREELAQALAASGNGKITITARPSDQMDNLLFTEKLTVSVNIASAVPIFLDIVNHATILYSGGPVVVNSSQQDFDAIHLVDSRPTISFNTIVHSANAAISASPNSFNDTFEDPRRYDHDRDRLGPSIHGNFLADNSINGVKVRIELQDGVPIEKLSVPARFTSTDIVYAIPEILEIVGGAGGLVINQNIDPDLTGDDIIASRPSGRLRIDPGVIVKLSHSRIETELGSSNLIAEGTPTDPIIFTSLKDDSYGAGGTFDTNNDSQPPAGQSNLTNSIGGGGTTNSIPGGASTQAFGTNGGGESGDVPQDVIDAAIESFNGPDGVGKDGPLAKLGWNLNILYQEYQAYVAGGSVGEFHSNQGVIQTSGTNALVDLSAGTHSVFDLAEAIKRLGFTIVAQAAPFVTVLAPIAQLDELVNVQQATVIRPVYVSKTNVGATTSQGDIAMNSDDARNTFGVDGSGVTVGVISDSFDTSGVGSYLTDQTTNDLPGPSNTQGRTTPINVLQDSPNGTDEGRAMLQLVHDVAPGANLQFATANPSEAAFANNIRALDAAGSDVIVDDVIYFAEPMFQDGLIAQAVDDAVANGKSYFSAAGNDDRQSYESTFVDSGTAGPSGGELHDFDPTAAVDTMQQYTIQPGGSAIFVLQWDQPFGSLGGAGSANDLDFLIYDSAGNLLPFNSSFNSNVGGDALEIAGFTNLTATATTISVGIELFSGMAPGLMKYVEFDNGLVTADEYTTNSPTSYGHANAQGAEAVGAAFYLQTPEFGTSPPMLEPFSSAGGIDILFDTDGTLLAAPSVRQTPDIVGPDGTNTTFFPQPVSLTDVEGDGFPNFFGTSAAAPHAAAVAALMLNAAGGPGTLSPDTIYTIMQDTAVDMDVPGVDDNSGYGFINAAEAVATAETAGDEPPPLVLGQQPEAGDWGGLVFGPDSSGNLDYVKVRYAGGETPIEGGTATFNPVEIYQADVRISNSQFEFNESGVNSNLTTDPNRNGLGANHEATVFIRGAQPTIVTNIFQDNNGNVISVDANALNSEVNPDLGRATADKSQNPDDPNYLPLFSRPFFGSEEKDVTTQYANNVGPLVRNNRMENNTTNGMEVRGGILTTESVWDDVDIVHVVRDEIITTDLHTYGGLRLQSSTGESLVVKLSGATAGFRAAGAIDPVTGQPVEGIDIQDRIGGTLQIVGTPGRPVVLTSITDNTVGAGFTPDGVPLLVTTGGGAKNGVVLGGEVNNGTLIDNDVIAGTEGHFDFNAGTGGNSGQADAIVQGVNSLVNSNFLFDFINYVDTGSNGQAVNLASTTINQPAALIGPDQVQSSGSFAGANGTVSWTVTQSIDNGTGLLKNVINFNSAAALGNLRFINYLDQDVLGLSDDLLQPTGTPGTADFRLFTRDSAEQVGFSQYGEFLSGQGLANATYDGFAADKWADLQNAIIGGGTTYTLNGNIDLTDLPQGSNPNLGTVYGPNDVTSAMAWSVNPNANSATITTYLELATPSGTLGGSPGDWRGVVLDQSSNDRNVAVINEKERATRADSDANAIPDDAEFLGPLAPSQAAADDNRRAGYEVHGFINTDNSQDQDVYSFKADAGTEVWFDIDRTAGSLDTVLELIQSDGTVVASSDNSQTEQENPDLFGGIAMPMIKDERLGGDFYTMNPKDAGMRVILPGDFAGQNNTYFIRVRSKNGLSSGEYQLQIRLRQVDEKPGSVVTYSDIRYADTGIQVNNLPGRSPLVGEAAEGAGNNDTSGNADYLGNVLASDMNGFGVAGNLSSSGDVDFYRFTVNYTDIQQIPGFNNRTEKFPVTFDIDYADQLGRANTAIYVFNAATGQLVLSSTDSNIADDRPAPSQDQNNGLSDQSRGTVGALDPFIGTVELEEGDYIVAVTSSNQVPLALDQFLNISSANSLIRLEPIDSISRIAEDHIGARDVPGTNQGGDTLQDPSTLTQLVNLGTGTGADPLGNYDLSQNPDTVINPTFLKPDSSIVPWNLGDTGLYVAVDAGTNITRVYMVDPFTGERISSSTFGEDVHDIDINRRGGNGQIFGLTTEEDSPATVATDANIGNLVSVDWGTGTITRLADDDVNTFIPGGGKPNNGAGVGVIYEAMTFNNGASGLTADTNGPLGIFAVGNYLNDNILYYLTDTGGRFGNPRGSNYTTPNAQPPYTDAVERGILRTDIDVGGNKAITVPDPTIPDLLDPTLSQSVVKDGQTIRVENPVNSGTFTTFEMDTGPEVIVNSDITMQRFIRDQDSLVFDGTTRFEFDTGPVIVVASGINGTNLKPGDSIDVTDDALGSTFSFTFGSPTLTFNPGDNPAQIANKIAAAINGVGITAQVVNNGGQYRVSLVGVGDNGGAGTVSLNLANGTTGLTTQGLSGVTSGTAIPVEEFYDTATLGDKIARAVNPLDATTIPPSPQGFDINRLTLHGPGFGTPGGGFINVAVTTQQAGVLNRVVTSNGNVGGTNIPIEFWADDTAQELAQRIATIINAQAGITATQFNDTVRLSNNGTAVFNDPGTDDVFMITGTAPGGLITGLTVMDAVPGANGELYAVSNATGPGGGGGFFRIVGQGGGANSNPGTTSRGAQADFIAQIKNPVTDQPIDFTGLTIAPPNVEGGIYSNVFVGIDSSGTLWAFRLVNAGDANESVEFVPIFLDGRISMETGIAGAEGLSFSNLDSNLWADTGARGGVAAIDDGHGINAGGTGASTDSPVADRNGRTGGQSIHFGNTANFTGGAHGSVETDTFSLNGYAAADQPVLYFNYYSETEEQSSTPGTGPMRDAVRVFIADDSGNWDLLATNDSYIFGDKTYKPADVANDSPFQVQELFDRSTPADVNSPQNPNNARWRQVRVDLAAWAGKDNLRLRFDFSNAASMNLGDMYTTGDELRAIAGKDIRDGQTFTIETFDNSNRNLAPVSLGDVTFEFNLDHTVILPAGAQLVDGDTLTVTSQFGTVTFEFNDPTSATPGQNGAGNYVINYLRTDTADTLADKFAQAIALNFATLQLTSHRNGARVNLNGANPDLPGAQSVSEGNARLGGTNNMILSNASVVAIPSGNQLFDAESVTITLGGQDYVFEFNDLNGLNPAITPGHFGVDYVATNSSEVIAARLVKAIRDAFPNGDITAFQDGRNVSIYDGDNVQINPSIQGQTLRLAVEKAGLSNPLHWAVNIDSSMTASEVADRMRIVIAQHLLANIELPIENIKTYRNVVRIIGHNVIDAGPLGLSSEDLSRDDPYANSDGGLPGDVLGAYNSTLRAQNNNHDGVYIDDIVIGFAERGEIATDGTNNTLFTSNTLQNPLDIETGDYQLEVRRGTEHTLGSVPVSEQNVFYPKQVLDTNDRLTKAVTIQLPDGSQLFDGQRFQLSDGVHSATFEFENLDLRVGDANFGIDPTSDFAIGFYATDSAHVVASHLRDLFNSTAVLNRLNMTAALSDGTAAGSLNGGMSSEINLFGTITATVGGDTAVGLGLGGEIGDRVDNNTLATALDLEKVDFSLAFNPNINDDVNTNISESVPHVSITGTEDAAFDYFKFDVHAGDIGYFDMDGSSATFNPALFLYDSEGNLLAENDVAAIPFDTGSRSPFDSYIKYTFTKAGTYIIGVGESGAVGSQGGITGNAPDLGDYYTLHVALENHTTAAGGGPLNNPSNFNILGNLNFQYFADTYNDPRQDTQLIDNGDFETGNFANWQRSVSPPPLANFAQNLDGANWNTTLDPTIYNSDTRPHISVQGTGNGTFDYYSFTVNAGDRATFDIDNQSFGLDSELFLYDSFGNLLTSNDDDFGAGFPADPGFSDALIQDFRFTLSGTYFIVVGEFNSFDAGGYVTGNPPDAGDSYTLNISIDNKVSGGGVDPVPEVEPNDFGTGNLSNWTINNGTFNPRGPDGTDPAISGLFDAVTDSPGLSTLSQSFVVPDNVLAARLSWEDRISSQFAFMDPNQEFRVELLDVLGNVITVLYSTNPGDPINQPGPNLHSIDLTSLLQVREGQTLVLQFSMQNSTPNFNVTVDNVSLLVKSEVNDGFSEFPFVGDSNMERLQGSVQISQNKITNSLTTGILINDDRSQTQSGDNPVPGAPRALPTTNDQRLTRGVKISNNVIAGFSDAGIELRGDDNSGAGPLAAVPFHRIINNTIYGAQQATGTGIRISNSSPTLINNIIANTQFAIDLPAGDTIAATTIVSHGLYQNAGINDLPGSNAINFDPNLKLFVDPKTNNFYLAAVPQGVPSAIDSARDGFIDRPEIVQVANSIGIPQSNLIAPEVDRFGQQRIDDPRIQNTGQGNKVFYDRGAVERADFAGPTSGIISPQDASVKPPTVDPNGDLDFQADSVRLVNQTVRQFIIGLNDIGIGIEDLSVYQDLDGNGIDELGNVALLRRPHGGTAYQLLQDQNQYLLRYNTNTKQLTFDAASGVFPIGDYVVVLNSGQPIALVNGQLTTDDTDPNFNAGLLFPATNPIIRDLAGNALLANRSDGTTVFSITLDPPPELSIGDVTVLEGNAGDFTVLNDAASQYFEVTLSADVGQVVSVDYTVEQATGPDAATLGVDFSTTVTTGTLVFDTTDPNSKIITNPDGSLTLRIPVNPDNITIIGDDVAERSEKFFVRLSNPVNANIGDDLGVGTITDDDLKLDVTNGQIVEGDSGQKNMIFTATLRGADGTPIDPANLPAFDVTFDYSTTQDTATADVDYVTTAGSVTIPAGSVSQTFSVPVIGDLMQESPTEQFFVDLFNANGAAFVDAGNPGGPGLTMLQVTGTIVDDDPKFSVSNVAVLEGDPSDTPNTKTVAFTVTASAVPLPLTSAVTVPYHTQNLTAQSPSDYASTAGTLIFRPIDSNQNIDKAGFAQLPDPEIQSSTTIPHVSIDGTGDGTFDYYSFTVDAGSRGIFDIDRANFNGELFLYDLNGNLIDANDDSPPNTGDGSSTTQPLIDHVFLNAGTYVIGVGRFDSTGSANGITGQALTTGDTYRLQVSLEDHALGTGPNVITETAPGPLSKTVTVTVKADNLPEGNEQFALVLDTPSQGEVNAINEVEPNQANNSIVAAQNVDNAPFGLGNNANITDSTTVPHLSINGTGDGSFDYYSFTVAAGDLATFDIDAANFNSELFLYDLSGNLLDSNDDIATVDSGSASKDDAFLQHTFAADGTYVIGVGKFDSNSGPNGITGLAPEAGDNYRLQLSIENHATAAGVSTINEIDSVQNVDAAPFGLGTNSNIQNATLIPHLSIKGLGDGTFDTYSFTVKDKQQVILDIDQANFDTELFVYDINGNLVAENDDEAAADPGDSFGGESFLDLGTTLSAGTYYVTVGKKDSFFTLGGVAGQAPEAGDAYTLNLSIKGHALNAGVGTILDDDPRFAISDAGNIVEGNSGTTPAVFTVTLLNDDPNRTNSVQVDYNTSVGNAAAPTGIVFENEPNNSLQTPEMLDRRAFSTSMNPNITDQNGVNTSTTIPHVTYAGRGDGSFDYFSFAASAGDRAIFDIDGASFDSKLFLFDAAGNLVASNDDGFENGGPNGDALDPDPATPTDVSRPSESTEDAFLEQVLSADGTYILAVGRSTSAVGPNLGDGLTGTPLNNGDQYRLHISIDNYFPPTPGSVNEVEPNNTLATAQFVDNAGFTLTQNDNIDDSLGNDVSTAFPHITISGTGDGTFDYYKFTVSTGQLGIFDIDGASFDTELFVYDTAGNLVASNDDGNFLDDGSTSTLDSFIQRTFAAGTYILGVGAFDSNGDPGGITGATVPAGATYTLNIAIQGHAVTPPPPVGGPFVPDGTATPDVDFTALSGTLTFAPGESSKDITVDVLGDLTNEPTENFFVRLSNGRVVDPADTSNVLGLSSIEDGAGEAVIVNDDAPTITINDPEKAPETTSLGAPNTITFTVSLSRPADVVTTIDYATANGTAIAGQDYVARSGQLTFQIGERTKTITITLIKERDPGRTRGELLRQPVESRGGRVRPLEPGHPGHRHDRGQHRIRRTRPHRRGPRSRPGRRSQSFGFRRRARPVLRRSLSRLPRRRPRGNRRREQRRHARHHHRPRSGRRTARQSLQRPERSPAHAVLCLRSEFLRRALRGLRRLCGSGRAAGRLV